MRKKLFVFVLLSVFTLGMYGQTGLKYQLPPKEIVDIAYAEQTPSISIGPLYNHMALLKRSGMLTISDLSREELRIAGLRIDPAVNGPSRSNYNIGISFMNIDGSNAREVKGLPSEPQIGSFSWSDDGMKAAFTNTTENSIELWVVDFETAMAKKIADNLNMIFRGGFDWLPDNNSILLLSTVPGRGGRPVIKRVPEGPVVQENTGKKGAARTYQDLLEDPDDERLFEYFATSQIMIWDGNSLSNVGEPGMYTGLSLSPDANYILVDEMHKPFSYIVPYRSFPSTTEIWTIKGENLKTVVSDPLRENQINGRDDEVFPGKRSLNWRSDKAATLVWVEALDEGDPKNEMEFHDQVFTLDAPFTGEPVKLIATRLRYGGITWGNENFALLNESSGVERIGRISSFDPTNPTATVKQIMEVKSDDRYADPGRFLTAMGEGGRRTLLFGDNGKSLYLSGNGASDEGDRPFIDKYDIKTGKTTRLWRSEAPYYETVTAIIDTKNNVFITNRQSTTEPPNYFIRNLKKKSLTQITDFKNPYPQFENVSRELVRYKRGDGIDMSFTVYLPEGYDKERDGPLPTLMWAYPREFKDADAAGQISGSPYRFTRVSASSQLVFVTQGYAILDGASFPIVGEGDQEPNDTFIEQLVANAEAAIDKAVEMGITDRERVAVGGHSYGAFMTANLLAHTDIFAAGIAESGAYNRTLTPFGFQNERRTYWEAPDLYFDMSPFMHADTFKDPILLIHGQADNNSGTFPIQSERLFAALKGHGAVVRYVQLPYESHGYAARESVLHKQWEILKWMDKYLKDKE